MSDFDRQDQRYLEAAQGWLELGNWLEANEELEGITPLMRAHPDVLTIRCKVYCDAKKWDYVAEVANTLCQMLPESAFGPLHLAYALPKLDRTKEARDALLPVADKFPAEWRIAFQLACYCCQLGKKKDALKRLEIDLIRTSSTLFGIARRRSFWKNNNFKRKPADTGQRVVKHKQPQPMIADDENPITN